MFPYYSFTVNPYYMYAQQPSHYQNAGFLFSLPSDSFLHQRNSSNEVSVQETQKTDIQKKMENINQEIIQISDEEGDIHSILKTTSTQGKSQQRPQKPKTDRFLGFKEGIFNKDIKEFMQLTNLPNDRALITRSQLRKDKKEKEKKIRKQTSTQRVDTKQTRNQFNQEQDSGKKYQKFNLRKIQQKPKKKKYSKLKKYLGGVSKTIDLFPMYRLDLNQEKIIRQKRESLLTRQIDQCGQY